MTTRRVLDRDRLRRVLDERERAERPGACLERGEQEPVLDIVAEGVEPDLGGGEMNLGRAQQPAGIVDDAHDAQRRRLVAAVLPDAQRIERRDRACQQRGGAVVGRAGRLAISAVSMPAPANAIAAVRPAGPPPTIATSTDLPLMPFCRHAMMTLGHGFG